MWAWSGLSRKAKTGELMTPRGAKMRALDPVFAPSPHFRRGIALLEDVVS